MGNRPFVPHSSVSNEEIEREVSKIFDSWTTYRFQARTKEFFRLIDEREIDPALTG